MDIEQLGALSGLRVIDLSRVVAGPLCAQTLADHGADVIKIESPAGDELRTYGPPFGDDTSAYYDGINRNKRNICVNLGVPGGREVAARLIEQADVVIENFRPGAMDRWGLGYEEMARHRPGLVYCRITGFGVDGPMAAAPGYDALLQAYSGIMSLSGEDGSGPTRVGLPLVDLMAAQQAVTGILLALLERGTSGRGQLIDCTLLDAALSMLHPHASAWVGYGARPKKVGNAHGSVAPYEVFQTGTGALMLAANNNQQFTRLVDELGRPELATDPRFGSNADRVANRTALSAIMTELVYGQDSVELSGRLIARGVPATAVLDVPEALSQPQVSHREMVVSLPGYAALGIPVKLSRTPGQVRTVPAAKGADTESVLREAGYGDREIEELIAAQAVVRPAPAGVA